MKVALVTAVIGDIDTIKPVPEQTVLNDRLLFTEPFYGTQQYNPRIQALFYKTQLHQCGDKDYDYYIWIDGKIQVTSPDFVQQCIDQLSANDIGILKHHERNCIYHEVDHIEHCISKGNQYLTPRYAHRPIRKQVEVYRTMGYPANNGLNDCKIMIVRGQAMAQVYDKWWHECKMDWFDQIAIKFLCWYYHKPISSMVFKPGTFNDVPHIK